MKKVSKEQIDSFFAKKKIAIAGASRNKNKFGFQVLKGLKDSGYAVIPINPNADKIDTIPCLRQVEELPDEVDSLLIVTSKGQTDEILRQAIKKGIKHIWVQQSAETADTLSIAKEYQQEIIMKKCIFMFAEPVAGIHRFHRTLVKIFGGLPKSTKELAGAKMAN